MNRQERCEKCGHSVEYHDGGFSTMQEVTDLNVRNGGHWFDAGSMRFFRSRIASGIIRGRYFISSERFVGSDHIANPRKYTIRKVSPTGEISEVGEFQQYDSLRKARKVAEALEL